MSDEFKIRVTLIVDSRLMAKYRIEAYRENTTQTSLINEALAGWLKFYKNVDRGERQEAEGQKTEEEILEIQKIQDEIVAERRLLQRRRSMARRKLIKKRKEND